MKRKDNTYKIGLVFTTNPSEFLDTCMLTIEKGTRRVLRRDFNISLEDMFAQVNHVYGNLTVAKFKEQWSDKVPYATYLTMFDVDGANLRVNQIIWAALNSSGLTGEFTYGIHSIAEAVSRCVYFGIPKKRVALGALKGLTPYMTVGNTKFDEKFLIIDELAKVINFPASVMNIYSALKEDMKNGNINQEILDKYRKDIYKLK